jgi:hypothetical protein
VLQLATRLDTPTVDDEFDALFGDYQSVDSSLAVTNRSGGMAFASTFGDLLMCRRSSRLRH